jgi:hypothetical protein
MTKRVQRIMLLVTLSCFTSTLAFAEKTMLICGGPNLLPVHLTIDTSANTVRYQMENTEDAGYSKQEILAKPFAYEYVTHASITAKSVHWTDPDQFIPTAYSLDRESKHLIQIYTEDNTIADEYDCH